MTLPKATKSGIERAVDILLEEIIIKNSTRKVKRVLQSVKENVIMDGVECREQIQ